MPLETPNSNRVPDANGWFEVPRNPLSRVGVFPYSKKAIGYPGWETDPQGIVNVYRPEEELSSPDTVKSFRLVPWTDDHAMLGNPEQDPALMPAEKKGVHGVIGERTEYDPNSRTLFGNIKVFSRSLADAIDAGKKELSCGFRCVYEFVAGVFEGQQYQAVQKLIRGNHLALVDHGRMGPGVAVLDSLKFGFDEAEIRPMKVTRRAKLAAKLGVSPTALAAAVGMDKADEAAVKVWNTAMDAEEDGDDTGGSGGGSGDMSLNDIADMLGEVTPALGKINEALAAMGGNAEDPEDPELDGDDMEPVLDATGQQVMENGKPKMQKKAAPAAAASADAGGMAAMDAAISAFRLQSSRAHKALGAATKPPSLSAMDAAISKAEKLSKSVKRNVKRSRRATGGNAMDSRIVALESTVKELTGANTIKTAMSEIASRDRLAKRVSPFIGTFDHAEMTAGDVAKYACDKLGLKPATGAEVATLEGYLHGRQPAVSAPVKSFGLDAAVSDNSVSDFLAGKPARRSA